MENSNTTKRVAEPVPAFISLNSDTTDWCTEWGDISKRFYINVIDSDRKPVPGISVEVQPIDTASGQPKLTPVNTPVTNEYGNATALYKVEADIGQYQVIAVQKAASGPAPLDPLQSEPMNINMKEPELPAPRVPAAFDGVIDDNDYAGTIVANVIAANMKKGDMVYLLWGDNELPQSTTQDAGTYSFFLTGDGIVPNELLFQNQIYLVRAFVADSAGNGRYSSETFLTVARANGGGGLAYCDPLDIPAGDDGFINEADVLGGVTINIPNGLLSMRGNDVAQHQLSEASAASINLTAFNKKGSVINTLNIPLDVANIPTDVNPYQYHDDPQSVPPYVLKNFLMGIGEGSIRATYNVTISDKTYTTTTEKIYEVDVIPPGGF